MAANWEDNRMARLRCLMIGAGGMAGAYVRNFFPQFTERVEIVGIAEIRQETLDSAGDFLGLPASARFTDFTEAFARVDADFCTIVIPPAAHRAAVLAAVERGLPILSEKPIADTWEACLDIYRAVTQARLRMQVVQNYRYTPRIMTLKAALSAGWIGRPNYIVARFAADYRERGSWGAFRHEIAHSLLVEGSVHHFDQIRNLAGADCHTIAGWEWNPGHPSFDGECCGLYVMRMLNDTRAQYEGNCLEAGWQNSWHQEYYRVEGDEGALVLDRDGTVRLLRHTAGRGLATEELPAVRAQYEGHTAIVDQFLTWMEGGPAPQTVIQDNIQSAAMLFAAVDASRTGQSVDVQAKVREAIAS
jgi:predicted dehydrogenase